MIKASEYFNHSNLDPGKLMKSIHSDAFSAV